MKFAEFKEGMVIHAGPITVTETEMLDFAHKYDPQWFHINAERAAKGRWEGLIASGWLTCGLAMRMAVDAVLHDSESFGSPGLGEVKWKMPVRAGDQLRLDARIQGVRKSTSRPNLGIVAWEWSVINQHNEAVLELEATSLFDLSQDNAA
jgi:acyl dehydratase